MRYYEVHCFFDRTDGYSIAIKVDDSINTDDDILKHCIDNNLFSQEGDENFVDRIVEIDFEDYLDIKG